jgi:hypothetical protein
VVCEDVVCLVFSIAHPPLLLYVWERIMWRYIDPPYRGLQSQHQLEQPKSLKAPLSQMTPIRGLSTVMKGLFSILGYLADAQYPTTPMGRHFALGWTPAMIASSSLCCADTMTLSGFLRLPHRCCPRRMLRWHISTLYILNLYLNYLEKALSY